MSAVDLSGLFAVRTAGLRSSFIRDILAVANDPGVISFAGGLPDPAHFPAAELAAATDRVLREAGPGALQYGPSEGLAGLREWVAERYREHLGREDTNTLRLNFTNASPEAIETGIARLGAGIRLALDDAEAPRQSLRDGSVPSGGCLGETARRGSPP